MTSVHVSTASNQAHATPFSLIQEVENRFGVALVLDLAASDENAKCDDYITEENNSLGSPWASMLKAIKRMDDSETCAWLNPPFRGVEPWMEKCKIESAKGCKIISLTLASLGTGWYRDHVEGEALSLILRERIVFEGQKDPFPKELMITLWGFGLTGLGFWSRKV